MNTRKKKEEKPVAYKIVDQEQSKVEERPFMALPELSLDLSKRYSYADYLTWFDDVRRELIDGFIHLMSGPILIHQRVLGNLSFEIESFIRRNKGKCQIFSAPFDVCFPKVEPTDDKKIIDIVQPDIIVVCDPSKLEYRRCLGAPDLIVEVTSPSSLKKDWNYKFNLYEEAGVREYWIVNPKAKILTVFILQQDGYFGNGTEYDATQKAPVHIFEGFEIDLKEVFEDI